MIFLDLREDTVVSSLNFLFVLYIPELELNRPANQKCQRGQTRGENASQRLLLLVKMSRKGQPKSADRF